MIANIDNNHTYNEPNINYNSKLRLINDKSKLNYC